MIDRLYEREKLFVYAKQSKREYFVSAQDMIFNLFKCHSLRVQGHPVASDVEETNECAVRGIKLQWYWIKLIHNWFDQD